MFDYTQAQRDFKEMASEFGAVATLRHDGADYPDLTIIMLEYRLGLVGGGLIAAGDRFVYMEAENVPEPVPNHDLLIIDGVAYKIVPPVRKFAPALITVYYELQVRR